MACRLLDVSLMGLAIQKIEVTHAVARSHAPEAGGQRVLEAIDCMGNEYMIMLQATLA